MDIRIDSGNVGASVQRFGAMVTGHFRVDGQDVSPLYEAPWPDYPADPMLGHLKGDFLCVPFGIAPESLEHFPAGWSQLSPGRTPYGHGYAANTEWDVEWAQADAIRLRADYPEGDAVAWVAREVSCADDAVTITDEIAMRRDARLPLGLHPMLRLPEEPGAATLIPPACAAIATYPVPSDASAILQPDARFASLSEAPLRDGGTIDLSRLPLDAATEELVLLCDVATPSVSLVNHAAGYEVTLEWDATLLRHCLLWISNRGRAFPPWNGRNLCLGVEPITSAFDLGTDVAAATNPLSATGLATAVDLQAGTTYSIAHRLTVRPAS